MEKKALEDDREIVKRWFVEESGTNSTKRPKFREMINYIEDEKIAYLYVLDTDRLARNEEDFLLIKSLREEFLTVVFVGEGYSLGSEKDDELDRETMHDFKKMQAIAEKRSIRRRTRRGRINKQDKGERIGRAPLGYKNDKENKIIIPDEKRWSLVMRCWTEYEKNIYSDAQIGELVTELGLRTKPTKRFPEGSEISRHLARKILNNRFYCGYVRNSRGEWIKGIHKPMISEALFEKCQRIRHHEEKQAVRKRTRRVFFPFRGLMVCGYCGSTITFQNQYKKSGKVYTYCICSGKHSNGRDYCQQKYYSMEEINSIFLNVVGRVNYDARNYNIANWIAENNDGDFAQAKSKIRKLNEKIKELDRQIHIIYQDRLRKKIPIEFFEEEHRRVEQEKRRLRVQIEELEITNPNCKEDIDAFLNFLCDLKARFQKMNDKKRHDLISVLGSKLILNGAKTEFIYHPPFDVLKSCLSHKIVS